MTFTCKANVPVTLVQPFTTGLTDPHTERVATFLAFYETFLDTFRGITINGAGTYAKEQPVIGLNLATLVSARLFAPGIRPTVPVRMIVIAGIPSSMPGVLAENHLGLTSQGSSVITGTSRSPSDASRKFLRLSVRFCSDDCGTPFQPDDLLIHCANPSGDPLIRLAKRRDIPVVIPLLDFPYLDRMAFYNVDYCLVASEAMRQRYWDELGLACVVLPLPTEMQSTSPIYADFFRKIHPQPGPPFVPSSQSR